ncbi:hypothetical protein VSR82_14675 [Burkholderia sp. JPY481]
MGLAKTREKSANRKPTALVAPRLWQRRRLTACIREAPLGRLPEHQKPDDSAETDVNIDERKVGAKFAELYPLSARWHTGCN